MEQLVTKYKKDDILTVMVKVDVVEDDSARDYIIYHTQLLNTDLTRDEFSEDYIYVDDKQVVKKLSQADITKYSLKHQQQQIKALQAEISERQAKIKAIELAIKPVAKSVTKGGK